MTSRVDLEIVLRLDPDEPTGRGHVAVTGEGDRPVVVVSDLQLVDELALGHAVAMLLVNAEIDAEESAP